MKNLKLIAIIIIFLVPALIKSQVTKEWELRHDGIGGGPVNVSVIKSGSIYVAGNDGISDFVILKYNSAGVKQFEVSYNDAVPAVSGAINSMVLDNTGNVYIAGFLTNASYNTEYLTVKYDSSGVLKWKATYNQTSSSLRDMASSIAVDASGNVYVTGYSYKTSTSYDFVTIKYNSSGVQQWLSKYTGTTGSNVWPKIAVDASGSVFVCGTGAGIIGIVYTTIKYNSSGVLQWTQVYYNGLVTSMALDASGNVYLTGMLSGNGGDFGTIKYNSSGVLQWAARYNGPGNSMDLSNSIAVDESGNVYVTGGSYETSNVDFATIKYTPYGAEDWVARYNHLKVSDDYGNSIAVDGSGNVFVTGTTADVDYTYADYVTIKYDPFGYEKWIEVYSSTGTSSIDESYSVSVDSDENAYVTGYSGGDFVTTKYSDFNTDHLRLNITIIIEGFYDVTKNRLKMSDTVTACLRKVTSPFDIVDETKAVVDSLTLTGSFLFKNVPSSGTYYISLKHRNSIHTSSKSGGEYIPLGTTSAFDFTTSQSQAYGNNMVLKGSRYCIYSGDVNQDELIDIFDLIAIDEDALAFIAGYVPTDLDGSNSIDGADIAIVENNVYNSIGAITPGFSGDNFSYANPDDKTEHDEVKVILDQNYPNPFNPVTSINFAIPVSSFVKLRVYDLRGREVAVLVNKEMQPGVHSVSFNASNLSSGVYYYKLETGSYSQIKKMTLIK